MSEKLEIKEIALNKKLVTSVDGVSIGDNFKVLKNLRYTDTSIKAIEGMTKVNTTALSTYLKVRNAIHFKKDQPSETHMLAQAYNSGETASQVIQNKTAIPNQGDFEATALHTDASGAGSGRFSLAPGGNVAYCNGKESMIWGGDEARVGGFINYDPKGTYIKDYVDKVNNTLTDSKNVATLNSSTIVMDSYVKTLLHLNNNVTDSSASAHTVTNTDVTFDSSDYVFGGYAAVFNGTTSALSIPDSSDFALTGDWTIDMRFKSANVVNNQGLYSQWVTGGPYFILRITASTVELKTHDGTTGNTYALVSEGLQNDTWHHLEVSATSGTLKAFLDGQLMSSQSIATSIIDIAADVYIGSDQNAAVSFFDGKIDEYRVSNGIARHTEEFTPTIIEYGDSTNTFVYVGSTRPLKAWKAYIGTANATAGTTTGVYWDGRMWRRLTNLVDGTASGGVPLAQTGSISFDSTDSVAKVKVINRVLLYWYAFIISDCDETTTISQATVNTPFQSIKDIWDGQPRDIYSCMMYKSGAFSDYTLNAYKADYDSANDGTYIPCGGLTTSEHILLGFSERMIGIDVTMVGDAVNAAVNSTANISYWNGTEWVSMGKLDDKTATGTASLNKSGVIGWVDPGIDNEFKKDTFFNALAASIKSGDRKFKFRFGSLSGSDSSVTSFIRASVAAAEVRSELPMYYYKVSFGATLSASVRIDQISGIPAQKSIGGYKFPLLSNDRLFLCSDQSGKKNSVLCSSKYAPDVYNGDDSLEFEFGDDSELTAGTTLYFQVGSAMYNITVFCKENETWTLVGNDIDTWVQYPASKAIGCVAPLTMKTLDLPKSEANPAGMQVAIWLASDGVYMFDGRSFLPIHEDIKDIFDRNSSTGINRSKISKSVADYDANKKEYRLAFASGSSTTLDRELVYDISKNRWFEIDRGSGKKLQAAVTVSDTDGNAYNYGFIDTGYMERLEYGTTFDGDDMTFTVQFGDMAIHKGSMMLETEIRKVKFIAVAKSTTANSVSVNHYGDAKASASTAITISTASTTSRVVSPTRGVKWGPYTFHSIKLVMTTNDETYGFEPQFIGLLYRVVRLDFN